MPLKTARTTHSLIDAGQRRGRGAVSNASGRFERHTLVGFDDGWAIDEDSLGALEPLRTEVRIEPARSIIARNQSPDISFDQSINPYRGCEHGCIYCYARPSHAFLGLSPGLDFETKLSAKSNAAELLERELAAPGYVPKVIALGANTDPYQPIERELRISRQVLEVLAKARHPVGIVTKSVLVLRDLDILAPMAALGLVKVAISITSLDRSVARRMEPRAASPPKRLMVLAELVRAGVPAAAMVAPIVPAITDSEIEAILAAVADTGAREAGYVLLRLPLEIKDLFHEWLEAEFPDRAKKVMALMRSMRGGKDYDAQWFTRQRGTGPYAEMIAQRFKLATKRLGINERRWPMRTDLFRPPVLMGGQMRLL